MIFRLDRGRMVIEENLRKQEDKSNCCVVNDNLKSKKKTFLWWHERLAHQNFEYVKKVLNENEISWENSTDTPFL